MKQGDRVRGSDRDQESAMTSPNIGKYLCECDGMHYFVEANGMPRTCKYVYPYIDLPEGFKPWYGGECPVYGETKVEVVFRDGETDKDKASDFTWGDNNKADDIIGYRVVKDYVDHDIIISNGSYFSCANFMTMLLNSTNFLGYVSDKGELMGMPLMWRNQYGDLRPYKAAEDSWPEVRAVAVRMRR